MFCSSALHGEKPYRVQHSNRQGWTWFEDAKRFVMLISRKASNIFPPNRLVRKVFLIVCFLWENFIELRIRIDRKWTCFKGAKWFVLMTSGKLWSLPPRKPIGSKSVFVDVLCKGNHIDLRIRTGREWAWFEDSKQFAMITSRWKLLSPKTDGLKIVLATDAAQQGKYQEYDHRQASNL